MPCKIPTQWTNQHTAERPQKPIFSTTQRDQSGSHVSAKRCWLHLCSIGNILQQKNQTEAERACRLCVVRSGPAISPQCCQIASTIGHPTCMLHLQHELSRACVMQRLQDSSWPQACSVCWLAFVLLGMGRPWSAVAKQKDASSLSPRCKVLWPTLMAILTRSYSLEMTCSFHGVCAGLNLSAQSSNPARDFWNTCLSWRRQSLSRSCWTSQTSWHPCCRYMMLIMLLASFRLWLCCLPAYRRRLLPEDSFNSQCELFEPNWA